jgi:hypothetical protein
MAANAEWARGTPGRRWPTSGGFRNSKRRTPPECHKLQCTVDARDEP